MAAKKLSEKDVREIRALMARGDWDAESLARFYGVPVTRIQVIAEGRGAAQAGDKPRRRLSDEDGEVIRNLVRNGMKQADVAREKQISQSYVSNIVHMRSLVPGGKGMSPKAKNKVPLSEIPIDRLIAR
jgi:plasmid maintenance system antidote protein VapI